MLKNALDFVTKILLVNAAFSEGGVADLATSKHRLQARVTRDGREGMSTLLQQTFASLVLLTLQRSRVFVSTFSPHAHYLFGRRGRVVSHNQGVGLVPPDRSDDAPRSV